MRSCWRGPGTLFAAALGLWLGGSVAACEEGEQQWDELSGSCSERFDLQFNRLRAYRIGPELVLAYESSGITVAGLDNDQENLSNQVARLSIDTEAQGVKEQRRFDFVARSAEVIPVRVARYVLGRDHNRKVRQGEQFPRIRAGLVEFHEYGENVGDEVAGRFELTFSTDETLLGLFSASLSQP